MFLFLLGIWIGMMIGIPLGKSLLEKLYKPLIESYKRDEQYWFDSYIKLLGWA